MTLFSKYFHVIKYNNSLKKKKNEIFLYNQSQNFKINDKINDYSYY